MGLPAFPGRIVRWAAHSLGAAIGVPQRRLLREWRAIAEAGLEPIALVLRPWVPRVRDGPYAYYGALRRS